MFVIDLAKIQPLDILLTTGAAKESRAIRVMESVARAQWAEFSHAAMFIAPTVLVESSDAGTVLEAFSNDGPGDELLVGDEVRKPFSGYNRTTRLKTRLLLDKKSDGLRIFGGLPDATKVKVIRHKSLQDIDLRKFGDVIKLRARRENLIEALRPLHLKDYPSFVALMRAGPIPEVLLTAFKYVAESAFGPVYDPGPYCSELVCLLLAQSQIRSGPRSAGATTPIDLNSSNEFKTVSEIVSEISDSEAASMVTPDIEKLLRFIPTPFLSPLVETGKSIAERIKYYELTGSRRLDKVTYTPSELGQLELNVLDEWCGTVSDVFWNWYRNAPACFAGCAEETRKRAAKWDAEIKPCASVYDCRSQAFGLHRVQELGDALINKRFDQFLRTMPP